MEGLLPAKSTKEDFVPMFTPEAAAFEDGGCGSHGRGADDHGARGAHQQSGASPQGTPPQREGAKSQQQQATGELFVQE